MKNSRLTSTWFSSKLSLKPLPIRLHQVVHLTTQKKHDIIRVPLPALPHHYSPALPPLVVQPCQQFTQAYYTLAFIFPFLER